MKELLKNIQNEVSMLISSNEKLSLYALKYISNLVLNKTISNLVLIHVEKQAEEYFKVLLPSNLLIINPTEEKIKDLLNSFTTITIGLSIVSNEFAYFKSSKNKSILFVDELGIFREGLINHYKNLHFIESKFYNYLQKEN